MTQRFPFLRLPSERHLWKKPGPISVPGLEDETTDVCVEVIRGPNPSTPSLAQREGVSPGIAFRAALAVESTVCEDCEHTRFDSIGGYYMRDVGPFAMRLCHDCVPDTGLWVWVPEKPVGRQKMRRIKSISTAKGPSSEEPTSGKSGGSRSGIRLPPLEPVDRELPDLQSLTRSLSRSLQMSYEHSDVKIYSSTSANTPIQGD